MKTALKKQRLKTPKKTMKTYEVNIDMKWSETKIVKAKTAAEAKSKAWKKFKKSPKRGLFELLADKIDSRGTFF